MRLLLLFFSLVLLLLAQPKRRPLVVVSVDGLDQRYLRDADKVGLKIPTIRKLMREGETSAGVVGVVPTVTWPSHTTLVTGVRPAEHGILGNRRPRGETGDYYWFANMIKVPTLWQATRQAGLKSATITWPVTVGADVDFNLPEYFRGRDGGSMDYVSIYERATPGLVEKIEAFDSSFNQTWVDDRTRTLATVYLLKQERPDLILLHLVDLDSESHIYGPYTKEAYACLEKTDAYIAEILAAAPKDYVISLTSDHGFERVDREINSTGFGVKLGGSLKFRVFGGLLFPETPETRERVLQSGILGREVPREEIAKFAPEQLGPNFLGAFEPKRNEGFAYGALANTELYLPPHEKGNHGFWPGLPDYRSVFVLWGPGIRPAKKPEMRMEEIAPRYAEILAVKLGR
ncbi:MAG: ectonucleotide pyrophosphatase/phosphodiesterase [Bryobacter sp.]|nr:ectonucleotide pyrophosphatase/phosphodiesterase [Bryobacter sp.]